MRVRRIRWESKYIADSSASLDSPEMFAIVPCQKPVGRSWDSKRNEEKKKTFVEEQIKKEKKRSRFDRPYIKIKNFLNIFNRNIYIYISFIYKEFNDLELANLRTKFSYGKSERVKEKSTRAIECKS